MCLRWKELLRISHTVDKPSGVSDRTGANCNWPEISFSSESFSHLEDLDRIAFPEHMSPFFHGALG